VPDAIEAAGASLRLLPAYSPDLNAIKQAFSKLKALRKRRLRQPSDRAAHQTSA
jgi:transposase